MTTPRPFAVAPAAIGLALATPVATWWLVGQQDADVPAGTELDYAYRPLDIDPEVERVVGIGSTLLAVVSAVVLLGFRRRFDRRWWSVLIPVLAAGVLIGSGWRVLTAGVIGANIGAGMMLLFGVPLIAALLIWAVGRSLYLLFGRRP
jgi:hypothetical protein